MNQDKKSFTKAAGVAEIAAAAQKLPACPPLVSGLLDEGSLLDQAVADLAQRTLPDGKRFNTAGLWQAWVDRLNGDLSWDGRQETFPRDQVTFDKPGVLPHRLVELWGDQPWCAAVSRLADHVVSLRRLAENRRWVWSGLAFAEF